MTPDLTIEIEQSGKSKKEYQKIINNQLIKNEIMKARKSIFKRKEIKSFGEITNEELEQVMSCAFLIMTKCHLHTGWLRTLEEWIITKKPHQVYNPGPTVVRIKSDNGFTPIGGEERFIIDISASATHREVLDAFDAGRRRFLGRIGTSRRVRKGTKEYLVNFVYDLFLEKKTIKDIINIVHQNYSVKIYEEDIKNMILNKKRSDKDFISNQ